MKLTDLYHALIIFFRIWSHGLQSHQRKSALWHYLYKFGRTNEKLLRFKGTLGVQAYCIPLINSKPYILPDHSRPIQVVIDPKVRKNSFVRVHPMFSRILNLAHVIEQPNFRTPNPQYFVYLLDQTVGQDTLQFIY